MTRDLLDEARRHDAAMTEGPWEWVKQRCVGPPRTVDHGLGPEDDRALIIETDSGYYPPGQADRDGIAWLRTNLRGLLDAHEQALCEVDALKSELEASECGHDSYAHLAARQNTELLRLRAAITALHTDAERWLTESDDRYVEHDLRPNLRAAVARLAAMIGGKP